MKTTNDLLTNARFIIGDWSGEFIDTIRGREIFLWQGDSTNAINEIQMFKVQQVDDLIEILQQMRKRIAKKVTVPVE